LNAYFTLISAVTPIFVMMALGYIARRVHWLTAEADGSLLRLTINILYPCFVLDNVLGNAALEKLDTIFLAPVVGFGTALLGYVACFYFAKLLSLGGEREQRNFAFTAGLHNYGYIPIPLIETIFVTGGSATIGVLLIHNVGVEICLWTAGVMLITGLSLRQGWRKILNPPVVAIVAAVALNFIGGRHWMPSFALIVAHRVGATAIPLGLILIGASFADLMRGTRLNEGWKMMAASCVMRLVVLPVFFVLLAKYLPCSPELKRVIVIQGAMPSAVLPIVLTKHYGGNPSTALQVVLSNTIVSLLTIPLWIRFGLEFAGISV
jgi:hypothetical protein